MAWTGNATVKKVADGIVRITGLSLTAGSSGTISQAAGTGDVKFGDDVPPWGAYEDVTLQDAVEVQLLPVTDVSNYAIPIRVVKTGVDPSDFLVTFTNDEAAVASADLEIYLKYHT